MPLNLLSPFSISKILMANSKGSRHLNRNVPSVDRISALPDSLLFHILSYLRTHFAVRTTILSKRWINLWTSLTSLHLDDEMFYNYDYEKDTRRFEQFVYRVFVLLKTPSLHKFFLLSVRMPKSFYVNTWVSAALSRNVRELIIDVRHPIELYIIPVSLFTCNTLSYLSLAYVMLIVPNSVSLPNLKYLHLSSVTYRNDESVQKLLSGCPILEELFVQRDISVQEMVLDNVVHFSISSPTLKSLNLNFVSDWLPNDPQHTLQIDAPMLQYLCLRDRISSDYVIGNLSSVVMAEISIYDRDTNNDEIVSGNQILKLLNGLSHVKFLDLPGATMKVLGNANELVPYMQNLGILEGHLSTSNQESWSIHPELVTQCWLSHLTTVEITDFDGSANELMMVKFILKGAKSLEKMTIIASHPETNFDLLQEIAKFPRDSNICELVLC